MIIGIVGLGRMGLAIAQRALVAQHQVIGFDLNKEFVEQLKILGGTPAEGIAHVAQVARVIWLMVPAGKVVDRVIHELMPYLRRGDILVDGGNSYFRDSIARAQMLSKSEIFYLDCGTSGGLHGKEFGFCLMVGGDKDAYNKIYPALTAIAMSDGCGYVGPSGSGHYVKMIHNGIEYALLQAYAEGLHLIKDGYFKNSNLDLEEITRIWDHGSIIRSWILTLLHDIVARDQFLDTVSGVVESTGMGRWTVQEAAEFQVPVEVIKKSVEIRDWSSKTGGNYGTKLVALLRHAFGGHAVKKL